jgi:hypothetical protein
MTNVFVQNKYDVYFISEFHITTKKRIIPFLNTSVFKNLQGSVLKHVQ